MTSQSSGGSSYEAEAIPPPEFQILILTENDQILGRAMQVCDYLMAKFDSSFVYQISVATFAALENVRQFQESLRVAQTADMIFVVSDVQLPATSMEWLQTCVRQHEDVSFAIADMTGQGIIDADALRECSVSGARHCGVDVIRQQPRWLRSASSSDGASRLLSQSGLNRWGIHE
jgi:hypothetical protein